MEGIVDYPTHSHGMIDPPKALADILESLIGAIFIDTDESMDDTWKVTFTNKHYMIQHCALYNRFLQVAERLLQPLTTPENLMQNPVAKFNEACQKIGLKPHANDLWSKTGDIEIYIDDEVIGRGNYKLKKIIAVNRAADDAYKNLFGKPGNKDGGIGG